MRHRREERRAVQLPVRLWGVAADGKPFMLQAETVDLTRFGARLKGIACALQPGDTIGVAHGSQKARYRVAWVGRPGTHDESSIGVSSLEPTKFIFGACLAESRKLPDNTPVDINATHPPAAHSRKVARRERRYKCDGVAEIRATSSGKQMSGRIAELSPLGCYIETQTPLLCEESLEMVVKVEGLELCTKAHVRSCHPNVGMGVEFIDMSDTDSARLRELLDKLGETRGILGSLGTSKRSRHNQPKADFGLRTGNTDLSQAEVDPRLRRAYSDATAYVKTCERLIKQFLAPKEGADAYEVLSQLEKERSQLIYRLNQELLADLDSSPSIEQANLDDLYRSVKQLNERLASKVGKKHSAVYGN